MAQPTGDVCFYLNPEQAYYFEIWDNETQKMITTVIHSHTNNSCDALNTNDPDAEKFKDKYLSQTGCQKTLCQRAK